MKYLILSLLSFNVHAQLIGTGANQVSVNGMLGSMAFEDIKNYPRFFTATASLDFPSIGPNSNQSLTMTVTGAAVGDAVVLGAPSALSTELIAFGFVSAANTVTVRVHNTSGGSVDPAAQGWKATVIKY
jgi:hypothetical protein